MTELERYIIDNRESFDMEPVPAGGRERFMAKVAADKRKRRIRIASLSFSGIAAGLAAIMVLFNEPDLSRELERQHTRLAEKENEIMILVEREYPYEKAMVENTIRSITAEAIPLEEQLPDEIPMKERIRILNDYYDHKYQALEGLIAEYANNNNNSNL